MQLVRRMVPRRREQQCREATKQRRPTPAPIGGVLMVQFFQTLNQHYMAAWAFALATLGMWAFVAYLLAVI